jgi:glutathione S-transferase
MLIVSPWSKEDILMKLIIGNKRLSSWSLRPWLIMKHFEIPFEEVLIPLDQPETTKKLLQYSPTAKVPVLIDEDLHVWDSIAIAEYLHEKYPEKKMWPESVSDRARARSISAEMHGGFHRPS